MHARSPLRIEVYFAPVGMRGGALAIAGISKVDTAVGNGPQVVGKVENETGACSAVR